ncbi:discoidin domain-containing protein [Flavisolibacter ginsenosidimutans]|uniref:Discoidin domain-containing protein n=1 Tax=Flavisolibacter ginsenosidimutans TaxID=661481 RepID=A0A5B8ULD2_9BACT|nr:discoidin domain-containing protein [Flavisolibacter ginsenosidimutans]QEC57477.1 discoidin domain-containing protein [Flavisolibacter ginsenosidimutans]
MKKCFSSLALLFLLVLSTSAQTASTLTVYFDSAHLQNNFVPLKTFGVGVDGHEKGENDRIFQPQNIKAMLSVGFKPVTYRLRTELGNEVWHWNPEGTWSNAKHHQGYWVSSTDTASFISLSYGYRLSHRGNTIDQANNDGYSRITDGDKKSFWKSNPYLDAHFTGEANAQHPQWIIVDLGCDVPIDAVKILWGKPFATSFTVDYAAKTVYDYFDNAGYFEINSPQVWKPFPLSEFTNKKSGNQFVHLANELVSARFLRIRMKESSGKAPKGSSDVRDGLGYAIKELFAGRIEHGKFRDFLHHAANAKEQSKVYVSSTDPWHRSTDMDSLTEQIGIDRFYRSGITSGTPALLSAGLLYDTPENATGLVDYVTKKQYAVGGVELGEEPDGQMVNAADFAELYAQWSKKIKELHPTLSLGGPSLQGIILDQLDEPFPTKKWMQGFVSYLDKKKSLSNYNFFSFEWYPFDSVCAPSALQLLQAPSRLDKAMNDMRSISALKPLPFFISEYGYSAFAGISEVTIQGALMNADIVGKFLSNGGEKAFLYGWEPNNLQSDFGCPAGNNMLFGMNDKGKINYHTAAYYGAEMMRHWTEPFSKPLQVYSASSNVKTTAGEEIISAYALRLPDETWSLLLINKDSAKSYPIKLKIANGQSEESISYPLTVYQYSGEQYQWKDDGLNGHPLKELPPVKKAIQRSEALLLPPYSLTVVRSSKQ